MNKDEQILYGYVGYINNDVHFNKQAVVLMKLSACDFAQWIKDNLFVQYIGSEYDGKEKKWIKAYSQPQDRKYYTIYELYDLYNIQQ